MTKNSLLQALLCLLFMTFASSEVKAQEAYAVFLDGTLTFYCDNLKNSREGNVYTLDGVCPWSYEEDPWEITQIIFKSSFSKARPTNTSNWFRQMRYVDTIEGIEYLNTSQVTDMSYMFSDCRGLTFLDVSHFDTSNVTDMCEMFKNCLSLTNLDVSHFNTSKVTNMEAMFEGCYGLTNLDVTHFDTSNVTTMMWMFYNCHNLTSLDVTNFNTSNVKNMWSMFDWCRELTSLDVSHFDVSNVENFNCMFYNCSRITKLDLSHFDTAKARYMTDIFSGCSNLETIYCSDYWTTDNLVYDYSLFGDCSNLKGGKGTTFDPNHVGKEYARIDGGPTSPGYFTYKPFYDCSFSDVPKTNAYYDATCYLYTLGVLSGTDNNGKMEVSNLLTRAHLAKIAFRGVYSVKGRFASPGVPETVPSDNFPVVYNDLTDKTKYYYQPARALLYLEYGDGVAPFDRNRLEFAPEENIARVHVLKVLMETFNIQPDMEGTDNPFPNDANVKAIAQKDPRAMGYIRKAASLGIITTANQEFRPYANCLRGEAFVMLYRIMRAVENGKINDPNPQPADYFEPLNTTLKTIALGAGLNMGNFHHYTKSSFALNGTMPITFEHSYNSYNTTLPEAFFGAGNGDATSNDTYHPLGEGWSHNYHTFITIVGELTKGNARVVVHWGGGKIDIYKSDGSKLVPESYGVYDEMSLDNKEVVIKTKAQIEYRFSGLGGSGGTGPSVLYLTMVKDRNSNTITINYEAGVNGHQRIKNVSDGNRYLTFSYRTNTNLLESVKDPIGRTVAFDYHYNEKTGLYQLSSFTDAKGQTTTYSYGDASKISTSKLLAKIQLPKGNYIENEYDNNRRLKKTISGMNGVPATQTQISVMANFGNTVSTSSKVEVDRDGRTSSFEYTFNENNAMTQMSGDGGIFSNCSFSDAKHPQLPTTMETNDMDVSGVTYDAKGNVTKITISGDGTKTTSMTYDDLNNVTSVTDPMGYKTIYTYDSKGNLIGVSSPEGVTSKIAVDSRGLPVEMTNAMGMRAQLEYNTFGNLTGATLPALNISYSSTYDEASRLTGVTDELKHTKSFSYDPNDNLVNMTDAAHNSTDFYYDQNDNLVDITNAKGGVTSMSYDYATDLLTSISFAGHTKEIEYNADGTVSKLTKPDGTTLTYSYNGLGHITNDGVNSFSYDNNFRLSSVSSGGKTLAFTYDGFNRIKSTRFDRHTNSYSYDKNDNCTSVNSTTYGYDKLNRMISVGVSGKTIVYDYRKDNQLSKVTYPNGMTTTYDYDAIGRLTGKTTKLDNGQVIAGYTFTLDKAGNVIEQTVQEPYSDMVLANEDVSYTYNTGNRIIQAGNISFSFDENGNTTKRGDEYYSWDKLDRLTKAGSTIITYDPLGLIASYGDIQFTTDPLGIGNIISDSKSGSQYIYGNGLEARVMNGKTSYYVTDMRGSVIAIVDDDGNITHKYQYDDFGNVIQSEEADYNPFQYVGKYGVMCLSEHLYYMRSRYYDPTIGRFLSEDPVWSTNLYPYTDNNPIMRIDPEGTDIEVPNGIEKFNGRSKLQDWEFEFGRYKQKICQQFNNKPFFCKDNKPPKKDNTAKVKKWALNAAKTAVIHELNDLKGQVSKFLSNASKMLGNAIQDGIQATFAFYNEYEEEIWLTLAVAGGCVIVYCSAGTLAPEVTAALEALFATYGYTAVFVFA